MTGPLPPSHSLNFLSDGICSLYRFRGRYVAIPGLGNPLMVAWMSLLPPVPLNLFLSNTYSVLRQTISTNNVDRIACMTAADTLANARAQEATLPYYDVIWAFCFFWIAFREAFSS